jgi:hypothetical protein
MCHTHAPLAPLPLLPPTAEDKSDLLAVAVDINIVIVIRAIYPSGVGPRVLTREGV